MLHILVSDFINYCKVSNFSKSSLETLSAQLNKFTFFINQHAIQNIQDVKFVKSISREGVSTITARFEDISEQQFDKRLNNFRREVQNKANQELPNNANDPFILELTTSNSFPTAVLVVRGEADDDILRKASVGIKEDIERLKGVDGIDTAGLRDPEIHIDFELVGDSFAREFHLVVDIKPGSAFGFVRAVAQLVGGQAFRRHVLC